MAAADSRCTNVVCFPDTADTIVFTNSTNEHLPAPRADIWVQIAKLVLEARTRWEEQMAKRRASNIRLSGRLEAGRSAGH